MDTGSRKWGRPYLNRRVLLAHRRAHGGPRPARHGEARRTLHRGRHQLHRRPPALRAQLGLHRGPSVPAFRGLLLSGDGFRDRAAGSIASRPARRASTSSRAATSPSSPRRRTTSPIPASGGRLRIISSRSGATSRRPRRNSRRRRRFGGRRIDPAVMRTCPPPRFATGRGVVPGQAGMRLRTDPATPSEFENGRQAVEDGRERRADGGRACPPPANSCRRRSPARGSSPGPPRTRRAGDAGSGAVRARTASPERWRGRPREGLRAIQSSCLDQRNLGNGADASAAITTRTLRLHGFFWPASARSISPAACALPRPSRVSASPAPRDIRIRASSGRYRRSSPPPGRRRRS